MSNATPAHVNIPSLAGYPSHLVLVTGVDGRISTVPANNLAEANGIADRYRAIGRPATVRIN